MCLNTSVVEIPRGGNLPHQPVYFKKSHFCSCYSLPLRHYTKSLKAVYELFSRMGTTVLATVLGPVTRLRKEIITQDPYAKSRRPLSAACTHWPGGHLFLNSHQDPQSSQSYGVNIPDTLCSVWIIASWVVLSG